jgi:hypothetical protein
MRRPAHRGRFGWVVALYFWNCLDREEAVDVGNQMGRGVVVDTNRPRIADLDDHVVCHSCPNAVIEIRGFWPWLVAWKDRDEASCQRFVDDIVGQPGPAATLQPVLTTQYQRMTVVDMASRTRATIDRGLICTNSAGDTVTLDSVIIESKSDLSASPLDRWLWRHGFRPVRISKCCTAMAAMQPDLPSNKWHRTLNRHFR